MARACTLEPGDDYKHTCGEVFLSNFGRLIYHCTLCSQIYDESVEFLLHLSCDHDIEDKSYMLSLQEEDHFEDSELQHEEIQPVTSNQLSLDDQQITYIEEQEADAWSQSEDLVIENAIENFECDICYQILESEENFLAHISKHKTDEADGTQIPVTDTIIIEEKEVPVVEKPKIRNVLPKNLGPARSTSKRKYKCKICGITMTQSSNMMGHIRRHSEKNRKFQCSHCPKKFFSRTEVVFHERTHTGERPFLCAECGSAFRSASQLTYHTRMHKTRERTFKCDLCDKAFFDNYRLRLHTIVHKEERDQFCPECNATFKHPKALAQHKKIHLNLRQYQCKICGARFNQGPGLRSHLKSIHHS